jgi:hypothetical protein
MERREYIDSKTLSQARSSMRNQMIINSVLAYEIKKNPFLSLEPSLILIREGLQIKLCDSTWF